MPDIREVHVDLEEVIRAALESHRASVYTALPCTISEDSDGHTCIVQPTIKGQVTKPDGTVETQNMPLLYDVPVNHPMGGDFVITHPVKKGDEGLLVFHARPVDSTYQSGGVQPPQDSRMHSLSDAHFIHGWRSVPRKLNPPPSTDSAQMRTVDGKHHVDLHMQNGVTLSSNNGAHTINVHPDQGLIMKTSASYNDTSDTSRQIQSGTLFVRVTPTRVDLGGTGGSPVMTLAGPSTKVFAII